MRLRLLPVAFALVLCPLVSDTIPALAAVPASMAFQGRLTRPDGTPVPDSTSQALTFRLFSAPTGGTALWSQSSTNVSVRRGLFAVHLDLSTGFTAGSTLESVLAGTPFLEVQADTDPPMSPRLPLSTGPYALRSRLAELALDVPDGSITGAKIAPDAITSENLSLTLTRPLELLSADTLDTPVVLGTATTAGYSIGAAVSGTNIYVINTGQQKLQVFDASNPASPVLKGTADTGILPIGLAVSGNAAYVVNHTSNTLQVFDISNPLVPTLKGTTTTALGPMSVAVSGNHAYVTNLDSDSLQVFDVSNPATPTLKGTATTSDGPHAVVISGQTAYVVSRPGNTLQVFDISNPTAPALKGSAPTADGPIALAISGGHAYVVHVTNVLQVFDVSNPSAPVLRGSSPTASDPFTVAVDGNVAYVACTGDALLQVFDVSNPAVPTPRGTTSGVINAAAVVLSGRYAYVAGAVNLYVLALHQMEVAGSLVVQGSAAVNGSASVAGGVGIGVATPAAPLHIRSNEVSLILEGVAGVEHCYTAYYPRGLVAGRGGFIGYAKPGSPDMEIANELPGGVVRVLGTFVNASDARYKTNIEPISGALSAVLGLNGVTYDWRKDAVAGPASGRQVGFIAQEVEKVRPDLVYTDSEGYKSVSYLGVVPLLVEAIKEMEGRKDAEIAALRAQNRAMEQRLQRLEGLMTAGQAADRR